MAKAPKVFIDGDIVAYRSAFAGEGKDVEVSYEKVDELISYILEQTLVFPSEGSYQAFLTGDNNFRFDIAKTLPYKGNRSKSAKPTHLANVREYLISMYNAIVSDGEEADDLIAIAATKHGPSSIIASIDKDFMQVPCKHFNFNKGAFETVTEEQGIKFFYGQILTGDRADNIGGLYNVGPVKAKKILDGATTKEELYQKVLEAYGYDTELVIENARLLWLRRYEGELWEPPRVDNI